MYICLFPYFPQPLFQLKLKSLIVLLLFFLSRSSLFVHTCIRSYIHTKRKFFQTFFFFFFYYFLCNILRTNQHTYLPRPIHLTVCAFSLHAYISGKNSVAKNFPSSFFSSRVYIHTFWAYNKRETKLNNNNE